MFLDNPICTVNEDKLKRSSFVTSLAEAIYNYKDEESFVIGICGRWGSGKTSVIRMLETELAKKEDDNIIVGEFSPWNYSSHNELALQFFKALKTGLGLRDYGRLKKVIENLLDVYSETFCLVDAIHPMGKPVYAGTRLAGKILSKFIKRGKTLEEIKIKLEEKLKEYGKKTIIIIDNIDRLSASQIKEIFQLVNQVADLPNIIYILSMDRTIVTNILGDIQKCDGNEFLEKILHITYNIPEIDENILKQLFLDKLGEVFGEEHMAELDKKYYEDVYLRCIKPYLKNIRDVNRVANSLQLKKGVLLGKVAIEDMVVMTCLELLEPDLHNWIYNNKESICLGGSETRKVDKGRVALYKADVINEFNALGIKKPHVALEIIARLFSVFALEIGREFDVNPNMINRIQVIKVLECYYSMSIHMRGPVTM